MSDPLRVLCTHLTRLAMVAVREEPEVYARFARVFQDHVPEMTPEDWDMCRALATVRDFGVYGTRPTPYPPTNEGWRLAAVIALYPGDNTP